MSLFVVTLIPTPGGKTLLFISALFFRVFRAAVTAEGLTSYLFLLNKFSNIFLKRYVGVVRPSGQQSGLKRSVTSSNEYWLFRSNTANKEM